MLLGSGMDDLTEPLTSWTIPLHVIMWTTIGVALIMGIAVGVMR